MSGEEGDIADGLPSLADWLAHLCESLCVPSGGISGIKGADIVRNSMF